MLRNLSGANGCEEVHYRDLCRMRGRVLPPQNAVYHQGDNFDGFYRVNSGVVMVYRLLKDSQRQIIGFYTQGDFFGMSKDDKHHDSAVTVATANVAKLTMEDVRTSPVLQRALFQKTCAQLDAAQAMLTTLTKKTASQKVATFLLMLAERQHKEDGEINLPMSRMDIADYLGLSIETVSRRFSALKEKGIISLPSRNTANIQAYDDLVSMAGALH